MVFEMSEHSASEARLSSRLGMASWWLVHSARTAVAATVSIYIARILKLPEPYWAAVSTIIVTQSTLGAALRISFSRFIGTVLGCSAAVLLGTYFGPQPLIFGVGVLCLGLVCFAMRLDRSAYRFAGISLCIVMMVVRTIAVWRVGIHRFVEVSVGIFVGLVIAALWPHDEPPEE